ncbi:hypothetical protein NEHOM01_1280 [Nematocida homosporus]|uniref:uncharacterized protein n=1 Tax=Nematocida homosporus TaxID=1912981 RepID=UPI00221E6E3B|nr:uncharacterized protein NEHOM01_1280 [Nematocida homosporus]KAI5186098.1 hypothetical protein NEHOM01_1280 [Nematocida homosporus]
MSERKFATAIERQLDLFRTATEWSDLVTYLTGLESILRMYKFSYIPTPDLFYRRLSQCLNPALPAGVHTKAMGVYRIILSKLPPDGLAEDIEILCLGLFSFYGHANLSTMPVYIETIKMIVETLGEKSAKLCRHIVLSVIMGLEEESSETRNGANGVLEALERRAGKERVVDAVWEILGLGNELVPGCIVYLANIPLGLRPKIRNEFARALECTEIVTVRKAFDLLVQWKSEGSLIESQEITLSVMKLLLQKEISLQKRVQQWIEILAHEKEGSTGLFRTLEVLYAKNPSIYFKVLTALHQSVENVQEVLLYSMQWLLKSVAKENNKYAKEFFSVVNRRLVWQALATADNYVVEKAIVLGLLDEVAREKELPRIIASRIRGKDIPVSWISLIKPGQDESEEIGQAAQEFLKDCKVEDGLTLILSILRVYLHDGQSEGWRSGLLFADMIGEMVGRVWALEEIPAGIHRLVVAMLKEGSVLGMGWFERRAKSEAQIFSITLKLADNAELFWAYDNVLKGQIQAALIKHLLDTNLSKDYKNQEHDKLLDRAFALVEKSTGQVKVLDKTLLGYLLSFYEERNSYLKQRRAKLFLVRLRCYREVLEIVWEYLKQRVERGEKEVVLVDCDYNKILAGVRILAAMLRYSKRFRRFITSENALFLAEIESAAPEIEFVLGKSSKDLRLALFSLLLVLICAPHRTHTITNIEMHWEEIVNRGLSACQRLLEQGERATVQPEIMDQLISNLSPGTVWERMKTAVLLGIEGFYSVVIGVYCEKKEVRSEIVDFVLKEGLLSLTLEILEASSLMILEGDWNEIGRMDKILAYSIGLSKENDYSGDRPLTTSSKPQPKSASSLVSNMELVASESCKIYWKEEEILWALGRFMLVYGFVARKIEQEKSRHNIQISESAAIHILEQIRARATEVYARTPEVFAEALIRTFSISDVEYLGIVDSSTTEAVFCSVLLAGTSPAKWKLLRKWITIIPKHSFSSTSKAFSILGMILSQARIKLEDTGVLAFLSEFYKECLSPENASFGAQILDVCIAMSSRVNIKRVADISEEEKRYEIALEMLTAVELVIQTSLDNAIAVDTVGIWNALIVPCFRLPTECSLFSKTLDVCRLVSRMSDNRIWKRDFYDLILSDKFFKDSLPNIKTKIEITAYLVDPEKVLDLVSRASSTGFFVRESDIIGRANLIKRLRFMILGAPFAEYHQEISGMLGLVSEIFSSSSGIKLLVAEAYSLCRALCIKMPSSALVNLWPIAVSEAISVIRKTEPNRHCAIAFSALRFLDLVASLDYPETKEFRWLIEGLGTELPDTSCTKRSPCLIKASEWATKNVTSILKSVAAHHLRQKHCMETDMGALYSSLIEDLSEI